MLKPVVAFVPYNGNSYTQQTVDELIKTNLVEKIYLISGDSSLKPLSNCELLNVDNPFSSKTMELIKEKSNSKYSFVLTQDTLIQLGQFTLERFISVSEMTGAGFIYSDYYDIKNDVRTTHPVIDYQIGSIRDDFNFGPVLLINSENLKIALADGNPDYKFSGLYDLRLKISQKAPLVHIQEYLYSSVELDSRKSGDKLFDYVNPKNRDLQIEMEVTATEHLKKIGAYLAPKFEEVKETEGKFEFEASVIIPVRNRVKTIADAVNSVLKQKTDFPFNLIVVDNFSDDGTTEILNELAKKDDRIIHVTPAKKDLGIGGCWNEAVHNAKCGKYAVQLDSDDIYFDENTLTKVVAAFRKEKCAMVVGSYKLTDFDLNDLPPGVIDHKEWTPDNGRNNALRINGLGAPRAFYTPVLREIKIPNVSYGEDYGVGLAISRNYQIGRIYEPIYICRRWDGNSDSALNIPQQNNNNYYKDKLRSYEVLARQKKNGK
jgi:hypothetical protein